MKLAAFVRDLPFRQKLRAIILLVSGSAVVAACASFLTYEWFATREGAAKRLEVMAEVVGDQTTATLEFNQAPQAEAILRTLKAERQIVAAALYARDGRIFARFVREGAEPDKVPAKPPSLGRSRERGDLLVTRPVRSEAEGVGTICLRSDLSDATERLMVDLLIIGIVLLGSTLAALVLSARLGGLALRPVERLGSAVDQIARAQDYSVRVDNPGRDELGRLTDGFNHMLSQIQARDAALARSHEELEARVVERTRDLDRANRELAAANKELERFSYSVAHDLRAPLRSIDGFNQLLLEELGDTLASKAKSYLQRSCAAAGRMGELIDHFLTLARVSRTELKVQPVDLTAMSKEVLVELKTREPNREVDVVVAPGLASRGDPQLLRALLENLLGNAWKFTSKRPRARIEVGSTIHEGKTAFYVRDDGAGFDMAYQEKLFRPFERLHDPADFTGTGIGLATVAKIVERHGGSVWAEAAIDRGATFYFTLDAHG